MSQMDARSNYEIAMSSRREQLERAQLDREIRVMQSSDVVKALRQRVSAMLVRLSAWVQPGIDFEPANDSALMRQAR